MGSFSHLSISSTNSLAEERFLLVDIALPLSHRDQFLGAAVLDSAAPHSYIKEEVLDDVPMHSKELRKRPVRVFELGAFKIRVRRRVRFEFIIQSSPPRRVVASFWVVPRRYALKADILLGKKLVLRSGLISDNRIAARSDVEADNNDRSDHGVR